ncbi:MAG TPA: hypothetical protein VG757_10925 [Devosia sp.]|nr:hypothetical protein [Devosia sp.]
MKTIGFVIFTVFCMLCLIWPLGNIADNYGGDRGPGNTSSTLAIIGVGSALVYFSQRLHLGRRKDVGAARDWPPLDVFLGSAAALLAILVGLWASQGLGFFLTIMGVATAIRAIGFDLAEGRPGWGVAIASDLFLGAVAWVEVLRLGYSELGFVHRGPVPDWAIPLSAGWYGPAVFLLLLIGFAAMILTQRER